MHVLLLVVGIFIPAWLQNDVGKLDIELVKSAFGLVVGGLVAGVGWLVKTLVEREIAHWTAEKQELREGNQRRDEALSDLGQRVSNLEGWRDAVEHSEG